MRSASCGLLRVQAALGLLGGGPASGAFVLAGVDRDGAVEAADAGVAAVVEGVVGELVARMWSQHWAAVQWARGWILRVARGVEADDGEVGAGVGLIAPEALSQASRVGRMRSRGSTLRRWQQRSGLACQGGVPAASAICSSVSSVVSERKRIVPPPGPSLHRSTRWRSSMVSSKWWRVSMKKGSTSGRRRRRRSSRTMPA